MSVTESPAGPFEETRLEEPDKQAAEALLRAFFVLMQAFPLQAKTIIPLAWRGRWDGQTYMLSRLIEPLAARLVWRVTGRCPAGALEHPPPRRSAETTPLRVVGVEEPPPDREIEAEARAVDGCAEELAAELDVELPRKFEWGYEAAAVGDLLSEQGCEAGLSLAFRLDSDGSMSVMWERVPPHVALGLSMERLFARIEWILCLDPTLAVERAATRWFFLRHASTAGGEMALGRRLREQEFSFVDRALVMCKETPLELLFIHDDTFAAIPAGQRRLATALRESFAGAFVVRERQGDDAIFEDIDGGGSYQVLGNGLENEYRPGHVGLGRLIPFDGRYVRAPSMVFLNVRDRGLRADMTRMPDAAENLPYAIVNEGMITLIVEAIKVPRELPPAESAAAAYQQFQDAADAFNRVEPDGEVPEELVPDNLKDPRLAGCLPFLLDDAVGEWVNALWEQADDRPRPEG